MKVTFQPFGIDADVRAGTTVLTAGRKAGVPIRTRCGGVAGCLMCKVNIADQKGISPPSAREMRKLGDSLDGGTRLACQTVITGDTTIVVPEDPLKAAVRRKLLEQSEEEGLW